MLQTAEWKEFKKSNALLANELLESVLEGQVSEGTPPISFERAIGPRDYGKQSTSSFSGVTSVPSHSGSALLSNLSSLFSNQRRGRSPGPRGRSPGPSGSGSSNTETAPNSASSIASAASGSSHASQASNSSTVEDRTPIRKRLRRGGADRP